MDILSRAIKISLVVVFLVGCSSVNATEIPISTSSPFSQPVPTVVNLQSQPKATIMPASTSVPSITPDITQTMLAQERFFAEIAAQTLAAQFPHTCDVGKVDIYYSRQISPNGLWMMESCYSETDQSPIMAIINKETQVAWKLLYVDFLPNPAILPDGGLSVIHWSNDGRYMYFNSIVYGSGGECFAGAIDKQNGKGLFRLDLQSGDSTVVLPLKGPLGGGYGFSFSTTGRRLLYETYSSGLNILDLQSGQLVGVDSLNEESVGGAYVWSPNGLQLVYSAVTTPDNWETRIYSLRLIDAQSGSQHILLESPEICFVTRLWSENNILIIEKYDQNYERTIAEFDLNSEEIISEATATPFP